MPIYFVVLEYTLSSAAMFPVYQVLKVLPIELDEWRETWDREAQPYFNDGSHRNIQAFAIYREPDNPFKAGQAQQEAGEG